MELIPVYFENVRRSALVIKPQKPFFDWQGSIEPLGVVNDLLVEGDVYLLPDYEEIREMKNWLKKNFDGIFKDQLNKWYTDTELWPAKRTQLMFNEWFSYSLNTMVWDTEKELIEKN